MIRDYIEKDFIRSSKSKDVKRISTIYRTGNYVYYNEMNKTLKKIIFKILNFLNNHFIKIKYGIEIPFQTKIGAGLRLVHLNGIIISPHAIIGDNCTIFQQVTIGANEHSLNFRKAPKIGDNVYIGAGAKIIGDIQVGSNVKIGANAVVTKNVPDNYTVLGCNELLLSNSQRKEII